MIVEYSADFQKSVKKLSGKTLMSVKSVIAEVLRAEKIEDITDCKKLVGFNSAYRIRIGSYRAFFTFHIQIIGNLVVFEYLTTRGEAYSKKMELSLRKREKRRGL